MILVVTSKRDLTCDFVILEMQRRNLSYFRFNTEDLPKGTFSQNPGDGDWKFELPDGSFNLSEVTAAYYRRPGTPLLLDAINASDANYCAVEWHFALQYFYSSIGSRWLNSPQAIATAENKIHQLTVARDLGFQVPNTLISNNPANAKAFSEKFSMIGKPLRNALVKNEGEEKVIFTSRVQIHDQAEDLAIRACPIIFQEEILKSFDVRVTVVGNQVFAATIDSQQKPDTEVDWRRNSELDLEHAIYNLSESDAARCVALTKRLGLKFGAIDFILDKEQKLWFLEINPNGQWGWIETRTGHPIAAALVNEMESISNEAVGTNH